MDGKSEGRLERTRNEEGRVGGIGREKKQRKAMEKVERKEGWLRSEGRWRWRRKG